MNIKLGLYWSVAVSILIVLEIGSKAYANNTLLHTATAQKSGNYIPGEVLIKFKRSSSIRKRERFIFQNNALKVADLDQKGMIHVRLLSDQNVENAIAVFMRNPEVEFAQPNYIYRSLAVPNDPKYGQLWGLKNTSQTIISAGGPDTPIATNNPGTSGNDMGLESAWEYITDCSSVIVAVVDSGVNYNHADLAANMWNGGASYPNHGYNFVDSTNDPMDKTGHGTHVAGTIGAVGNNGVGSTGVCWSAKIMAVRVLDATGTGTSATITQGINFAVTNGAKVINLSVGGSTLDSAYNTAITNAQSSGVVVVAAAGNNGADNDSGTTPTYPCNYTQSNLVCVAALDQSYALASFSNYGSTSVDVGAPGVNIVSEWPGTATTVTDALTSGWNGTGGWGYKSLTFGVATDCLVDPPTYDRSTVGYANNAIHKVYKNIDLSGADVALLDYKAIIDTQLSHDFFSTAAKAAGGDPFSSGTTVASVDGTTSGLRTEFTYDISFCNTATCTIGFQISADNDGFNDYGVGISLFSINKLSLNTTSYNVIAGTSMAAPHVAGVAAMLMAYNPNYTYQDVVTAIKSGGIATASLSGKTTTGNAVSAMGSLAYINAPTGVAVVKQ